jgi:hypothetical protein
VVVAFSIFEKSVAEAGAVLAAFVAAVVEATLVALVAVLAAFTPTLQGYRTLGVLA